MSLEDHDAEQALVHLVIWERSMSARDIGLPPEALTHPVWREVWRSALALEASGKPANASTVADHLSARGALQGIGGPQALLTGDLLVFDGPERIERVRMLARRRTNRDIGHRLAAMAHDENLSPDKAALDVSSELARLVATGNRATTTFRDAVNDLLDKLHQIRSGEYQEYLPTGIEAWDEVLQGLQRAKLGLLGAYPSVGKGAVMLRAILNAAAMGRKPGIFSLEDLKIWMAKRYVANYSGVPVRRLMQADRLPEIYEENVERSLGACHEWADRVLIEDSSALTDDQIACQARQWVVKEGCTEIWIDNASEVDTTNAPGERTDLKVGRMVRLFRDVAKDLNVPVWLLVHFKQPQNSTSEEPRFLVPTSSMWKNSGAFAEASRNAVALFLDKEEPEAWVMGKVTKQTEGGKDSIFSMKFNASAGIVENNGGRKRRSDTGYTPGAYREEEG
jgi:replicative DNA helicase